MKKSIFLISALLVLASCTAPTTPAPAPAPQKFPQTQTGTPAEKFCIEQGGAVSHESTLSGTMDRIYCTTKTGEKVDAWQYLSENTKTTPVATGTTLSGANM